MLYGDGTHDDTSAIQELLDSGEAAVRLPLPKDCYLISRPLRVHSRQQLLLDRYCRVRLADGSNCLMLTNAGQEAGDADISIVGGIWDMNNLGQAKNPFHFPCPEFPGYNGLAVFFRNVTRLRIADLTVKDPITFAITLTGVRYFTVENIDFDFNYGNPWAVNMDGVHLDGGCSFGAIRNIKGSCYDDMIALNADEGDPAPITDIEVDGLFADDCHSAVRLLACQQPVERVHICNVYGTYYQYCIGLTKYYDGESKGYFDAIVLSDIFAAKAPRYTVYRKDGSFVYPFLWVENNVTVRNMEIRGVYRRESSVAVETIGIDPKAVVENLTVRNVAFENRMGVPMPVLLNQGHIGRLRYTDVRSNGDRKLVNRGVISECLTDETV